VPYNHYSLLHHRGDLAPPLGMRPPPEQVFGPDVRRRATSTVQ
jgi:hypothetical protein